MDKTRLMRDVWNRMFGNENFVSTDHFVRRCLEWIDNKYAWAHIECNDQLPDHVAHDPVPRWVVTICSVSQGSGATIEEALGKAILELPGRSE